LTLCPPLIPPDFSNLELLEQFGFSIVREKEHISMVRKNLDGTTTPLTLPNHKQMALPLSVVTVQ
jgi:hypothetical protein